MNPRVKAVNPTDNYQLILEFTNGECGIYNCKNLLDFGVFKELKQLDYFKQVAVLHGTVSWPHEQDICPDTLYLDAIKMNWLDEIRWTADGLVPAIAQDANTGKILMFAWMNRESLALTAQEGYAVYWSRSRNKLWRKGEESGHRQKVLAIQLDCDEDVVLLKIEQEGGIACHTGRESCFYRQLIDGQWQAVEPVLKNPNEIYK
jgi:phosphoribosyl-AMP cyclohydrolase